MKPDRRKMWKRKKKVNRMSQQERVSEERLSFRYVMEEGEGLKTSFLLWLLYHVSPEAKVSTCRRLQQTSQGNVKDAQQSTGAKTRSDWTPSPTARLSQHLQLVVIERPESSSPTICASITAVGDKLRYNNGGELFYQPFVAPENLKKKKTTDIVT